MWRRPMLTSHWEITFDSMSPKWKSWPWYIIIMKHCHGNSWGRWLGQDDVISDACIHFLCKALHGRVCATFSFSVDKVWKQRVITASHEMWGVKMILDLQEPLSPCTLSQNGMPQMIVIVIVHSFSFIQALCVNMFIWTKICCAFHRTMFFLMFLEVPCADV